MMDQEIYADDNSPQRLIEDALLYRVRARQNFTARVDPFGSDAAASRIAALTNSLHSAYDALNGIFQSKVAAKEYKAAARVKDRMDDISLLLVALSQRVIELYERDAVAAAETLGEVQREIEDATGDLEADDTNWSRIGGAVAAVATAVGIAT